MASINVKKRKLAEDAHDAETLKVSHKRHHSDQPPLSSIALLPALNSPSEEVSGEGDGSKHEVEEKLENVSDEEGRDEEEDDDEDNSPATDQSFIDEENYPHEDKEEDEPEPEEEKTRAAGLEAKAEAGVLFPKNELASDPESTSSLESPTELDSDAETESNGEPHPDNKKKERFKADDPDAFASSMSAILGHKLTRTQRANPILVRSADAKEAEEALLDMKLEKKARAEMKRQKDEKNGSDGTFKEIHNGGAGDMVGSTIRIDDSKNTGSIYAYQQREKALRKMAEKGVVKMFNAFTHVRQKTMEAQGMGGSRAKKEEKATEMTKEGWLEYVGLGGKGKIEEKGKGRAAGENSLESMGEKGKIEKKSGLEKKSDRAREEEKA